MNLRVRSTNISATTEIISSKSELHRLLLLASRCENSTEIKYSGVASVDVNTTAECLINSGCKVEKKDGSFIVTPHSAEDKAFAITCRESGSTLRFILPFFASQGKSFSVEVEGRLGDRPLSPLYELMCENGVTMSENGKYPLSISGRLKGGSLIIDGSVSSQFITGLLMALPLTQEGGSVTVTGDFQSKPYVDVTLDAMRKFGVDVTEINNTYTPKNSKYTSNGVVKAGGDWSNGAFFACMGAIGGRVKIEGLEKNSKQGDKAITDILSRFGAKVSLDDECLIVEKGKLRGCVIDAKDIPDLVPTLAVVGALSKGETRFINAQRLRIKESDRIKSVVKMINDLGGEAKETEDGLLVVGKPRLSGGVVDGCNDHRIVMSAAVAALGCEGEVVINGAQAVSKSFPTFFEEIEKMGYMVEEA